MNGLICPDSHATSTVWLENLPPVKKKLLVF